MIDDDTTGLETRLRAGVAPARDLLAGARRPAAPARDLASLVALGADEAQAFLEALLEDRAVASAALEETLARAVERLESGDALDLVDLLGLARERGVAARRLLDGKRRAPALSPEDRAAVLLAHGLGLTELELGRAGVRDVADALARGRDMGAPVPLVAAPDDVLARVGARRAAAARIKAVERATPDERLRCTYCHGALSSRAARRCAACLAPHHGDCFVEYGCCAAPGCGERRVLRQASGPSWWRVPAALASGALVLAAVALSGRGDRVQEVVEESVIVESGGGRTPRPAPPPPGPSPFERELAEVRARMAGAAPDWAAISVQLVVMEGRYPSERTTLRPLRDDCEREARDEERYRRAVDALAVRDVEQYPTAVQLLEPIDPRSRVYPDAQAYLQWVDADLKVRQAQRAYDLGDDARAIKLLNDALQHEALGPEARASVRARRQTWGRVVTAYKRGMELFNADRGEEARQEFERVVQLEPNRTNTFHRRALDQLRHLQALESYALERLLREGLDALQGAEYAEAHRLFVRVRAHPDTRPGDLQRIQDAVVEADRARRLLFVAQQDFRRDRQERFLEIYDTTKLLRGWLPAGEQRADAERLHQDVLKRLKVLQMISGVEDER